jgi:hypothetical protein
MHRICAAVCETAKTDSLVEGEGFKNPHLGRVRGKSLSRLPRSTTPAISFCDRYRLLRYRDRRDPNPSPSATCASVPVGAGNKKLAKPAACREQHLSHRRQRCYYRRIQVGRLVTQSSWTNTIKVPAPVSSEWRRTPLSVVKCGVTIGLTKTIRPSYPSVCSRRAAARGGRRVFCNGNRQRLGCTAILRRVWGRG